MGIKELWPILTPYCERKPINVLRGKIIAIDLAGWVCQSLNVVDYFIHPRNYMRNLFFRTCYMLLEGIIPVFILEGKAPELKAKTIKERNDIQFRGVKPREKNENSSAQPKKINSKEFQGRTKFNYVLKNCELLLNSLGVPCVQAPSEAEAYCAFLNKYGFVDGIISQDSDCFAYGAVTVYRNFAVSSQGANAAQGGSIDIYDMRKIREQIDFGQEKAIALALFCGCDYINGITGIGKDSVLKLFKKYNNSEILERITTWRCQDFKYAEMEVKINDKNICSNCGHLGKTISHSKSGCSVCNLTKGCLETNWKEEKLIIKAEVLLRQKTLQNPHFPFKNIIKEFMFEYNVPNNLNLTVSKPNMVKFIKAVGNLLQWTEIYCFEKVLPILTRWQLNNLIKNKINEMLLPDFIVKKRVVRGNPAYEIVWKDEKNLFEGLIPDEQIQSFCVENTKGSQALWTTIEPFDLFERAYPDLVDSFINSKKKPAKKRKKKKSNDFKNSLNMSSLIKVTEEISCKIKKRNQRRKGLQLIDKFFYKNNSPEKFDKNDGKQNMQCSTPKQKLTLFDLDNEHSWEEHNLSDVINDIVSYPFKKHSALLNLSRKMLVYETTDIKSVLDCSKDDMYLLPRKRKGQSDDTYSNKIKLNNKLVKSNSLDDMLPEEIIVTKYNQDYESRSYFFQKHVETDDFEKSLVINLSDSDVDDK